MKYSRKITYIKKPQEGVSREEVDNIIEELKEVKLLLERINVQEPYKSKKEIREETLSDEDNLFNYDSGFKEVVNIANFISKSFKKVDKNEENNSRSMEIDTVLTMLGLPKKPNTKEQKIELKKLYELLYSFGQKSVNKNSEDVLDILGMILNMMSPNEDNEDRNNKSQ